MRISPILPLLFLMTAALTACDHNTDSVARLNEIPFGGVNEANIAAMVVNPADLVRGHDLTPLDGKSAAAPVQRHLTGTDKKLLGSGSTETGTGGGGGGGAGASGG
jgi:type IV pilus biogenesis protein CpaD/CtpE